MYWPDITNWKGYWRSCTSQGKENKVKSKPARVRANSNKGLSEGGKEKTGKKDEEEKV